MNSQLDIDQHDYNFSGAIYDESTDNAPSTDDEQILNENLMLQSVSSRHSSVSSFPASVVHHNQIFDTPETPPRSPYQNARTATPNQSPRPHSTGFRHPSSVRALQMRDEFESTDCEELTPGHRRRNSKLSYISYRSSGSHHSSPTKSLRVSRSIQGSPSKSKLKQEFPLVLLHCTLLPPSLNARAQHLKSEAGEKDSLLEAIIPEPYVKRWKTLQEKVLKNGEVKQRGVLIPHPKDDYELLEERLLESLELERPRIREGHYLESEKAERANDSGFESASTDSESQHGGEKPEDDAGPSTKCPDCGHQLSSGIEQERKWEVKVFAANGLMRAGAWAAAWNEMEKVDVEVSIWMPEETRREVDERLEALIAKELETKAKREKRARGMDDVRAKEIYGEQIGVDMERNGPSQAEIDGLVDEGKASSRPREVFFQAEPQPPSNLSELILRSIQVLAQDRRNIAILLLSMLVLFYGTSSGKTGNSTGEANSMASNGSIVSTVYMEPVTTSVSTVETAPVIMETTPTTSLSESTTTEIANSQESTPEEISTAHTTCGEPEQNGKSSGIGTELEDESSTINGDVSVDGVSQNHDSANNKDILGSEVDTEQSSQALFFEDEGVEPDQQVSTDSHIYDEL